MGVCVECTTASSCTQLGAQLKPCYYGNRGMYERKPLAPPPRGGHSWILALTLLLMAVGCVATAVWARGLARTLSPAAPPSGSTSALPLRSPPPALVFPSPTPLPTPTPTPAPTPTMNPDDRKRYREIRADVLAVRANELKGEAVKVAGTISTVESEGANTRVQLEAPGRIYFWAFFKHSLDVKKGQAAQVYGTVAGLTTITADNGKTYKQPYLDPAQYIDVK